MRDKYNFNPKKFIIMKTVNIKISGYGRVLHFANFASVVPNDEEIGDYIDMITHDLIDGESITLFPVLTDKPTIIVDEYEISNWGVDHTVSKYVESKLGMNLPCFAQIQFGIEPLEFEYEIELSDDEEFDPNKLQLVVDMDLGIVAGTLIYNGKTIGYSDWVDGENIVNLMDNVAPFIYR